MKKREKFLLSFAISWIIVMSIFLVWQTKTAIYYSIRAKEEYDWLYKNDEWSYESLTEEAKQYFEEYLKSKEEYEKESEKEYIQFCSEHPKECNPTLEHQMEIMDYAGEYYSSHVSSYIASALAEYAVAYTVFEIIIYILSLTLIIYSIITIEFKNKKQYFVDNVKLLLIIIIFYSITFALNFLLGHVIGGDWMVGIEYTANEMLEGFYYDITSILVASIITWGIIYVPNLIINLIKNSKKKKLVKEK